MEQLRIEALNFALRYPPTAGDVDSTKVVADATAYLGFLQGDSTPGGFNTDDE